MVPKRRAAFPFGCLVLLASCWLPTAGFAACVPVDLPDAAFVDSNCDGIDGDESNAIFVALTGSDAAAGTKAQPKRTINAGIAAAAAVARAGVYVSKGDYAENIVLAGGVSVYGGYDAGAGWSRSLTNVTRIVGSANSPAVSANALTAMVTLQLLTIQAGDASGTESDGSGRSSYGVRVTNSPMGVKLELVNVHAGIGAPGANGSSGATGAAGGSGGNASGTVSGNGGSSPCGAPGGAGANAPTGPASGSFGASGIQASAGGISGPGGSGGAAGSCSITGSSSGGSAPAIGNGGGTGPAGANGAVGPAFGGLDSSGIYRGSISSDGALGRPGGGGGGGGSGGGSAVGTTIFCSNCAPISGGAGGGGGGGGCGGSGGSRGHGGGASFALASVDSLVIIQQSLLFTAVAGDGGWGADGAPGGAPGAPGAAAGGQGMTTICAIRSGGSGAAGAAGGAGGVGGGAAGGAGGPSVCVVYSGVAPLMSGGGCTTGVAGSGGTGGMGGVRAPAGLSGLAVAFAGVDIPTSPSIESAPPPAGTQGVPYVHPYVVLGTAPLAFAIAGGGLPPGLSISTAGVISGAPTQAGTFTGTVTVTNGVPPAASQPFSITIAAGTTIPRLANISTRMQVLTGNDVLIGGFVIGGATPKTVVVRARGPSLIPYGITNALANPVLQLVRSSDQATLAINDNWGSAANSAAVTLSGFAPDNSLESAILVTLDPGAYTAIVTGAGGATGVGIIEVFEVDHPEVPLINISTRGQVLTGNDVMIGGFVIQGNAPQTVVVRARGPSLIPYGITNALANPTLQLVRSSDQVTIGLNDNWGTASNAAALSASGFAPDNSLEAAILVTLDPGAYTAIVTGVGGTTGVAIIEVFAR